jgi:hypothetical protein
MQRRRPAFRRRLRWAAGIADRALGPALAGGAVTLWLLLRLAAVAGLFIPTLQGAFVGAEHQR